MGQPTDRTRLSRILVVEDEATELAFLIEVLESEGFNVVGCTSATEALDLVQQEEVGVAIVDLRLPDQSGTDLLELLRAKCDRIRVIIHTGYGSYESAKNALNLGAFAYVEKGGHPGELLRHVHRALLANIDRYALGLERVVAERDRAQAELKRAQALLEERVRERTADLYQANEALQGEILERCEAEAAQQRSEARFRLFADTVREVLWMHEPHPSRYMFVNKAFERIWGYSSEHLHRDPTLWEESIHEADRPRAQHAFRRWLLEGAEAQLDQDYRIVRADGHIRWIHDRAVKMVDPEGVVYCLAGVAADITERKLVEEALREREQQLLQALEDRDTISQDLHDGSLQSLYSVGLGLETCKSLLRDDLDRAREHLDCAIAQLNVVMREMRYFIAGLTSDVLIAGDLQTSIEKLVGKLTHTSGLGHRIDIGAAAAGRLRRAERMQLMYIVQEAVSNSIRHARASEVRVSLEASEQGVQLSIQDDGRGYDAQRINGRGHGLRNIASRVKKVGGALDVRAGLGRGTHVTVTFRGDQ